VAWKHLLSLDLAPLAKRTLLQGAIYEAKSNQWFLAQAKPAGLGDAELMQIHRYSAAGKYLDTMTLQYAHQMHAVRSTSAGVQVWFGQDRYDKDGVRTGRRLARLLYRPQVETADSKHLYPVPENAFASQWARPVFCPDTCHLTTLAISGKGVETYVRRRTTDVLDAKDLPLDTFTFQRTDAHVGQGVAVDGEHIYRLYGAASDKPGEKPVTIYKNRWSDGAEVGKQVFNRIGLRDDENRGYEPEGLTWYKGSLVAGVRVGSTPHKTREFRLGVVTF
jgi:hypothetical protein